MKFCVVLGFVCLLQHLYMFQKNTKEDNHQSINDLVFISPSSGGAKVRDYKDRGSTTMGVELNSSPSWENNKRNRDNYGHRNENNDYTTSTTRGHLRLLFFGRLIANWCNRWSGDALLQRYPTHCGSQTPLHESFNVTLKQIERQERHKERPN